LELGVLACARQREEALQMKPIPLYYPITRRRSPLRRGVRIAALVLIGVVILDGLIKGLFHMMPLAEAALRAHGFLQ
jgi:hypothetical protein